MTYLLYQHSQYAAFDRLYKAEVMIITPGKSVAMGDLKISKTDVKVQWLDRDQRKLRKTDMVQRFLAAVQRVKHCIGTKNRSLSRPSAFKIPICTHHKM